MNVKEVFTPHLMTANSSLTLAGVPTIGGFLASATGTIAVTVGGVPAIAATAVTAGQYTPIPISVSKDVVVTLAGDAAGTLFA